MVFDKKKITTSWFFSAPPWWCMFFGIYVKGDALVLVPMLIALGIVVLLSFKLGIVLLCVYMVVRALGEMMYWLFQQFGPKTYRPHDFGYVNLNNDAIYIIYQLRSLANILIGIGILSYLQMN